MLDVAKTGGRGRHEAAGADYADAPRRAPTTPSRSPSATRRWRASTARPPQGLGIRVLVDGYWGFAATAAPGARGDRAHGRRSRSRSRRPPPACRWSPSTLAPVEPVTGTWHAPMQEDPFTVPLEEKVALLMEATRRMQSVDGLTFAEGGDRPVPPPTWFASRARARRSSRRRCSPAAGIEATAIGDGEHAAPLVPELVPRPHHGGGLGAHPNARPDRGGRADRRPRPSSCCRRRSARARSPRWCSTSGQVELQVHESIGHPVELDRVLGMEEAYAGSSFVRPEDRGTLRYASPLVSITADASLAGGLGLVRLRRRGRPGAAGADPGRRRVPELHLEPRDGAASSGSRRPGAMRADGWAHLPADPHDEHLARAARGLARRHHRRHRRTASSCRTNQSWSIDDKRVNFQFGCEIAWRIENGRLTHDVPEPELHGHHDRVLGFVRRRRRPRGLDAVGHAELRQGPAGPGRARRPRRVAGAVPRTCRSGCAADARGPDRARTGSATRRRGGARACRGVDGVEVLFMHEWGGLTRFAIELDPPEHVTARTRGCASASSPRAASASRRRTTSPLEGARAGGRERAGDGRASSAPDPLFPGLAPPAPTPEHRRVRRGDGRDDARPSAPRPSRSWSGSAREGFTRRRRVRDARERGRRSRTPRASSAGRRPRRPP